MELTMRNILGYSLVALNNKLNKGANMVTEILETSIQKIEIVGLHGDRHITLDFNAPKKILVDGNGSGKTTFLNLIVAILQGNISKIRKYEFQSITIVFSNNPPIKFEGNQFSFRDDIFSDSIIQDLLKFFPFEFIEEIYTKARRYPSSVLFEDSSFQHAVSVMGIKPHLLATILRAEQNLRTLINQRKHNNQKDFFEYADDVLKSKFNTIQTLFPYKILYFPTYRLVEENLSNLEYTRRDLPIFTEQIIQFGMSDVQEHWNYITQEMRNISVQGFARINGRMLDELTEEINPNSIKYDSIGDENALALVLSRSGDSISQSSKARILELVNSGEIKNKNFQPLAYFLSNLIAIHEEQKEKDKAINDFVRLVNEYLQDKQVFYDASELLIGIKRKKDGKAIKLENLSSGEKQIVSIFSKIVLDFESNKQLAIFFDEPELSLSMEWQQKLLQDIVSSEKCAFLLAATHSPFIYDNQLVEFSDVLNIQMIE